MYLAKVKETGCKAESPPSYPPSLFLSSLISCSSLNSTAQRTLSREQCDEATVAQLGQLRQTADLLEGVGIEGQRVAVLANPIIMPDSVNHRQEKGMKLVDSLAC